MKIGVLGTGMVGRAHTEKLASLGYDVMIGTQDVKKTLAKTDPDQMGNPPFKTWHSKNSKVKLGTFLEVSKHAPMILNALNGKISLKVLKKLKLNLSKKILIDISNPLDFSKGMPPTLFVCNDNSLSEQIQKLLPQTKVVKTLNTTNAYVQVNPKMLARGDHSIFISGNDKSSKTKVEKLLNEYGWKDIIDLGDIKTARGAEMILPIWLSIWNSTGNPNFNFKIVQGPKPQ